ncbi:transmembrane protease serine 9-like [Pholidichthys leucotaenia]
MHASHSFMLFCILSYGQNAFGSKIIHGKKVSENSMLFMASVQNVKGHHCGGFLVSEDFVITAAHCNDPGLNKVVLGTHDLRKSLKTERGIAKKCIHPNFTNVGKGNDIMLLKLSSKIKQSNTIKYAQLGTADTHVIKNEKCIVAGWGLTKSKGDTVKEMRQVEVSVISEQQCKKKWRNLPEGTLCAGGFETDKGFCQGDSGGPLVCDGKAVGIVSFNNRGKCDYPDYPNVYVDISKYLGWICKVLNTTDYLDTPFGDKMKYLITRMHVLYTFLVFGVLSYGQNALGSEIIHGKRASDNSLQFMASVQVNTGHWCGGSLVSEDFVLTAAHCDNPGLTKVVLGTHNLRSSRATESNIAKKCKHPSYKNVGDGDDVMLLKLSKKIHPSQSIQYATLPSVGMNVKENEKCLVAGWGMVKTKGHSVDVLRQVEVSVISQQDCKNKWPKLPYGTICAGGFKTDKGFCQGDSGGPLMCNGKVAGIVSFNNGGWCDYPDFPNIYVDVSKHIGWIKKVLNAKDC